MSFKILPDSSAWIAYFRNSDVPTADLLEKLIEVEADLCLCGPVITEVLQGVRSDKDHRLIQDIFNTPEYLEMDRLTFEFAAEIYRACRAKGFTIRSTVDCIIASTAIQHDAHLLHCDGDYEAIARFYPLRIYGGK